MALPLVGNLKLGISGHHQKQMAAMLILLMLANEAGAMTTCADAIGSGAGPVLLVGGAISIFFGGLSWGFGAAAFCAKAKEYCAVLGDQKMPICNLADVVQAVTQPFVDRDGHYYCSSGIFRKSTQTLMLAAEATAEKLGECKDGFINGHHTLGQSNLCSVGSVIRTAFFTGKYSTPAKHCADYCGRFWYYPGVWFGQGATWVGIIGGWVTLGVLISLAFYHLNSRNGIQGLPGDIYDLCREMLCKRSDPTSYQKHVYVTKPEQIAATRGCKA